MKKRPCKGCKDQIKVWRVGQYINGRKIVAKKSPHLTVRCQAGHEVTGMVNHLQRQSCGTCGTCGTAQRNKAGQHHYSLRGVRLTVRELAALFNISRDLMHARIRFGRVPGLERVED